MCNIPGGKAKPLRKTDSASLSQLSLSNGKHLLLLLLLLLFLVCNNEFRESVLVSEYCSMWCVSAQACSRCPHQSSMLSLCLLENFLWRRFLSNKSSRVVRKMDRWMDQHMHEQDVQLSILHIFKLFLKTSSGLLDSSAMLTSKLLLSTCRRSQEVHQGRGRVLFLLYTGGGDCKWSHGPAGTNSQLPAGGDSRPPDGCV